MIRWDNTRALREAVADKVRNGHDAEGLAEDLGLDVRTVRAWCAEFGVYVPCEPSRRTRLTDEALATFRELYERGETFAEMSKATGLSVSTLTSHASTHRAEFPKRRPWGRSRP